jgi:HAD superfamily hydrolase (TIGR01509 family)
LNFYKALKVKIHLYILTSDIIQDSPEFQFYLKPIFSKVFSASKMNMSKKDKVLYEEIVDELSLKPDEILYIDDVTENIQAAQQTGIRVILYKNNADLIVKVRKAVDARP